MAWHLIGSTPLSKSNLAYHKLDPEEWISMIFESKYNNCHTGKQKCHLHNGGHCVSASMCYLRKVGLFCADEDNVECADSHDAHWFRHYSHGNRRASVLKTTNVAQSSGCPLIPIWYHPSKGRSCIYAEPELGCQFAGRLSVPGIERVRDLQLRTA